MREGQRERHTHKQSKRSEITKINASGQEEGGWCKVIAACVLAKQVSPGHRGGLGAGVRDRGASSHRFSIGGGSEGGWCEVTRPRYTNCTLNHSNLLSKHFYQFFFFAMNNAFSYIIHRSRHTL